MTDALLREEAVLDLLRERYNEPDTLFVAHPGRDLIPSFLQDYRPDAIVRGPTGNFIIEVKRRQAGGDRLAQIANLFRDQNEWQFKVFFVEDFGMDELATSSIKEIRRGNAEFESSIEAGNDRAALLIGWSVLEAIFRRLVDEQANASKPKSALQIAETLEQLGYVSAEQGRVLRLLAKVRNGVAHGQLHKDIDPDELEALRDVILELTRTLRRGN